MSHLFMLTGSRCWSHAVAALTLFGQPLSASAQYGVDMPRFDEHEVGIHYFGSAKDAAGNPLADVTFLLQSEQGSFVFVTNADGRFRGTLPIELPISAVTAKCLKQGFAQVRVVKRPGALAAERPTVQVDCILRRARSK
ncbi:MAG: hypothetical protein AB7N70_34185 [Dehalococcoidia bacterium]